MIFAVFCGSVFFICTFGEIEAVDPDLEVSIDLASYVYPEGKFWGQVLVTELSNYILYLDTTRQISQVASSLYIKIADTIFTSRPMQSSLFDVFYF